MTFPSTDLKDIYETLLSRKRRVGGVEYLEVDEEEYKILRHLGQQIVKKQLSGKKHRFVFLVFAIAHARRHDVATDDAFWDGFWAALDINSNKTRYDFITQSLLWQSYADENILRRRGSNNKLYVATLRDVALGEGRLRRDELIDFFEWYYETNPHRRIDRSLIQQYENDKGQSLNLPDASLSGLQRHCHILREVIDYALEEELFLRDMDFETYRAKIEDALGEKYDFDESTLLSDRDALGHVVRRVENHYTPRQFRRELEAFSPTSIVQCPDGRKRRIRSSFFKPSNLPYGRYVVENSAYRIVPKPWIRLQSIGNWEIGQVVSLRRSGYRGYRKDEAFSVKRGRRRESSKLCYLSRYKKTHIWAGPVEPGKPLVIDGNPVEASIGISPLSVDLQLGRNEEDEWVMRFVVPSLDVFCPNHSGAELTLLYKDQPYSFTLDGKGTRSLRRAASFIVDPHATEATFRLLRNGEEIDTKKTTLESTYLFSATSYGRIPAGTEREWGDHRYYLFTRYPEDLEIGKSIEVERLEATFGTYSVFEVRWSNPDEPFFLSCQGRTWTFERSRYFTVQCRPTQRDTSPFELQPHQVYNLSDIQLDIQTNLPLDDLNVEVEVSIGKEHDTLGEFNLNRTDKVSPRQLRNLDERREERTGPVEFFFYLDNHLIDYQSLAVLPKARIAASTPLYTLRRVGKTFPIRVLTDKSVLWNPATGTQTSTLNILCTPTVNLKASEERPPGILDRAPAPIRKRLYLPSLDEAFHLCFSPSLCDAWIFEKSGGEYQEVRTLNYYQLADSALLVLSTPQTCVRILAPVNDSFIQMREAETNEAGSLLIEDLSFLASRCEEEHSKFLVESRSCQIPIGVRWAPRLYRFSAEGATVNVRASGPADTELIIVGKSNRDETITKQAIPCQGDRFEESRSVDELWSASEVLLQFRHASGERRTAKRLRLSKEHSSLKFPRGWLNQGVGVSYSYLPTSE